MYRMPQYASTTANSQKNPLFQHQTMFALKDTAIAPPQMLLDHPEYTIHMSRLLEKALQNGPNIHMYLRSRSKWKVIRLLHSIWMSQYQMGSTAWNRSCTLFECYNLPQKNDAPHWVPVVATGVFSRTIKSLVCALGTDS